MNQSNSKQIDISITKDTLGNLCKSSPLDYRILDPSLGSNTSILSLSINQNGTNTIFDFSQAQYESKIRETLAYIEMYFMQECDIATILFNQQVTV